MRTPHLMAILLLLTPALPVRAEDEAPAPPPAFYDIAPPADVQLPPPERFQRFAPDRGGRSAGGDGGGQPEPRRLEDFPMHAPCLSPAV